MEDFYYNVNSVEQFTPTNSVAFTDKCSHIFKEDVDTTPITIKDNLKYMPWGADNSLPYDILDLIEKDETLSTCQIFNSEVCYGSGLVYNDNACTPAVKKEIDDFMLDNDIATYFLGVCQDFKHFGWCVSVIILDKEGKKVTSLYRKEAIYCRLTPIGKDGHSDKVLYANWRKNPVYEDIEQIKLLNIHSPWRDLQARLQDGCRDRKFAIISRIPTPDSTYYPIPYYASLFRGKWYNIKQLIGIAKEAKLKNSAPIKYHVEISRKYWDDRMKDKKITSQTQVDEEIAKGKKEIIDFITGAENAGKVLFSNYYVSPNGEEQHDVLINKIDDAKEGGDWESDIQEAVNMFCFTMRVHSNLVGSVPGKSQTNNSGSDKRELYTIAQALQKPYHDLLFTVHRVIMRQNSWEGAFPECPFIQLTTLDENKDAEQVSAESMPDAKK